MGGVQARNKKLFGQLCCGIEYRYEYIYMCVCLGMYSSYEYENDWAYDMIVNFVVRTNLGLDINICMSLAMCMGPLMKKNMIQRKGRSFITALSLADLSLAALRLTALSLAPISLGISIRILLRRQAKSCIEGSAQARKQLLIAKQMAAALIIRMVICMSLGMCIGLRMNMNMMGRTL